MKLADDVLNIYEVIKGIAGELTTMNHGHRHEVVVDDKGNGKTVSVLNSSNEPIDQKSQESQFGQKNHVHIIKDGVIMPHEREYKDHKGKIAKEKHDHKPSAKG